MPGLVAGAGEGEGEALALAAPASRALGLGLAGWGSVLLVPLTWPSAAVRISLQVVKPMERKAVPQHASWVPKVPPLRQLFTSVTRLQVRSASTLPGCQQGAS